MFTAYPYNRVLVAAVFHAIYLFVFYDKSGVKIGGYHGNS